MAARIEAPAGDHLLAVKVCTAAVGDDGRVRLRFTDEQSRPLALRTSSDLSKLALRLRTAGGSARDKARTSTALEAGPRRGAPAKSVSRRTAREEARRRRRAEAASEGGAQARRRRGRGRGPGHEARRADARARPRRDIVPPPGVTVVRTALEKALAVGDAPSTSKRSPPPSSARSAAPTTRGRRARPASSIAWRAPPT